MKVYTISCSTGCSCCRDDNHLRGFYKTREDAERRIAYFKSPESKYWPLASQYARRGCYRINEEDAELISNNRVILNNNYVYNLNFIDVKEDGTVENNDEEQLY